MNEPAPGTRAVKLLVAGGFGVGKTTLVGAISEIAPLRTEEMLSEVSAGVDDLAGVESKHTTTVALDFGRITISDEIVLYLFGTPGQQRFWFMWDELATGAIGAVVLADTRRLDDCFSSVDFFESRQIPFVLAVNCFDGAQRYSAEEVRAAVDLPPLVPVVLCDARQRPSVKEVLMTLLRHLIRLSTLASVAAAGAPTGTDELIHRTAPRPGSRPREEWQVSSRHE